MKVVSDVSRDDQKVESENRPVGTASEPTGEGDSGTEEAPVMLLKPPAVEYTIPQKNGERTTESG